MLLRLGNALTFLGLLALVFFLITFSAGRADLRTLLAGAGLAIIGLILRRRGAPSRSESVRFVTVRKVLRGGPEDAGDDGEES